LSEGVLRVILRCRSTHCLTQLFQQYIGSKV